MTLHDFIYLVIGSTVTGLAGAAIYAGLVVWLERPSFRKIWSALRGQGRV